MVHASRQSRIASDAARHEGGQAEAGQHHCAGLGLGDRQPDAVGIGNERLRTAHAQPTLELHLEQRLQVVVQGTGDQHLGVYAPSAKAAVANGQENGRRLTNLG